MIEKQLVCAFWYVTKYIQYMICHYPAYVCHNFIYCSSSFIFGAFFYARVCVFYQFELVCTRGRCAHCWHCPVLAAGNVSLPASWQTDDIIDAVQCLGVRWTV